MRLAGNRRFRSVVAATLVATVAIITGSLSAGASPSWQAVTSMTTPRAGVALTRGSDGRLYAIGGKTTVAQATVEAYNTGTNSWASVASLPVARVRLAATHDQNLIYAVGGSLMGGSVTNELDTYDPTTDTWTVKTSMPTARKSLAAVALGGDIYAIGGENILNNQPNYLDTVEVYIPSTDTWTTVAPLPDARSGLAATVGPDGRIYAIGGYSPGCACTTEVTAYSPITNTWTSVAPLPTGRRFLDAVTGADGNIYAVGGLTDASTDTTEVDVYNAATNTWTVGPSLNTARDSLGVAKGLDGAVYAVGGFTGGVVSGAVERLQTDTVPPSGTVSVSSGAAYSNSDIVPVDVTASDSGTGVSTVRVSNSPATSGGLLTQYDDFAYATPVTWNLTDTSTGGTAGDGVHTVYVQWEDGAGNWSSVSSDSITLDTAVPTVQAPFERIPLPAALGTTAVPVVTTWTESDAGSGVCSNTLLESVGGGPLAAVFTGTATSTRRSLSPGSYLHAVHASDCAGNTSATVSGPSFTLAVVPESSPAITYTGTWKTQSAATAYGGALVYTTQKNASASFTITGHAIAWVSPTGPTRGSASVLIDGVAQPTVNLNTPTVKARQVVFTHRWAKAGKHTITIINQATSGTPRIDLDGIVTIS
jgi:N-acetylneuraminic acid mutarotase